MSIVEVPHQQWMNFVELEDYAVVIMMASNSILQIIKKFRNQHPLLGLLFVHAQLHTCLTVHFLSREGILHAGRPVHL